MQLYKSDPKPDNPIRFLHDKLAESANDMDELHGMKETLSKLTEDVSQMKADISKIASAISKFVPERSLVGEREETADDSAQSMENNASDESHLTELNDSSLLFDETMNSSVGDCKNLQSTMQIDSDQNGIAAYDSNENKHPIRTSLEGFTLEFIDVDVVQNKSSQYGFMSPGQTKIEAEAMQIDEMVLNSTVESDEVARTLNTQFSESQTVPNEPQEEMPLEELPIVMKEEDSEEQS